MQRIQNSKIKNRKKKKKCINKTWYVGRKISDNIKQTNISDFSIMRIFIMSKEYLITHRKNKGVKYSSKYKKIYKTIRLATFKIEIHKRKYA